MKKLEVYEILEDEVEIKTEGKPDYMPPVRDPNKPCIVIRRNK